MSKKTSQTPATLWLTEEKIPFESLTYDYVPHGGSNEASTQLGIDEHITIKTLVMQDEQSNPLIILMHGNYHVSTKNLAREIGAKSVEPCKPDVAQRHSGYMVGGTSPFGLRKEMPIYVEKSILDFDHIFINGGKRGLILKISPHVLLDFLQAVPVECALKS